MFTYCGKFFCSYINLVDFIPVIDPCFIGDIFNYHILVDNIAKILPYDKTLRFV